MKRPWVWPQISRGWRRLLLIGGLALSLAWPATAQPVTPPTAATATTVAWRRINVWPTAGPWTPEHDKTAPIFWFGRATTHDNYVDVRMGYTAEYLYVFVTVVDYFLWETATEEPRGYDGIALYLDTAGDRAAAPQPDDYFFFNGWRNWPNDTDPFWQRRGRGTGSGWNESWTAPFTATVAGSWFNTGPNVNGACPTTHYDCDAGWATIFRLPFASLGLSSQPAPGTVWGFGLYLYDRDAAPPAPLEPAQTWPEGLVPLQPATWGQLAFAPAPYQPQRAVPAGTTVIRRGLGSSTVADAYVGGGGNCSGGLFGGADTNYGSEGLFVASQSLIGDFPCWSKSYLRFGLEGIPPGRIILSATLTLHLWGNAGPIPSQSDPSYIQLSAVGEPWNELNPNGITWNNAPLATQNLTARWVYPRTDAGPDFPGIPYTWDATQAVAEAYAAGQPLNVAFYTPDTVFDSSKYFVSSDASSDWIPEGKPTLTVTWGMPAPELTKRASRSSAGLNEVLTYTLGLLGAGTTVYLNDPLPPTLAYVDGSVTGGAHYQVTGPRITWTGALTAGQRHTVTFAARVTTALTALITNTATLTDGVGPLATATALVIANGRALYLPVVLRQPTAR